MPIDNVVGGNGASPIRKVLRMPGPNQSSEARAEVGELIDKLKGPLKPGSQLSDTSSIVNVQETKPLGTNYDAILWVYIQPKVPNERTLINHLRARRIPHGKFYGYAQEVLCVDSGNVRLEFYQQPDIEY